jgi:hypothetical protein
MLTTQEKCQAIGGGLFAGLLFGAFIASLTTALDMPDVHFSHSTGECVKVLNYVEDDVYTCDNLPSKYNKVWVK